ncbi:MAG: hypothetical protein EOT05_01925 [Candidatus Microsaccharimonas sossegonensis]|uniref:Uncharacterized protein n=1 Tax=Candidatus Microsaccharimonas sossegonensis TaxID=2506948 RepID=A0A4Q0AHC3_9BACT|nr:MAG: hypothetical protein EOT05_01925 [Candidatus Microsaccharimonas sossegonensis]
MSAERQTQGPENTVETPKVSAEHYEKSEKNNEAKNERLESGEKAAEKARVEALETAISIEKGSAEKKTRSNDTPPPRRRGGISKKEKNASYKKHMKQLQAELPPAQRAFSKFIHAPIVEKASEIIGGTVARPNAVLSGAVVAFVLVLAVYLIAKYFGYVLSGFETIGAFIIGWVIGILYDYFKVLVTGKK